MVRLNEHESSYIVGYIALPTALLKSHDYVGRWAIYPSLVPAVHASVTK